MKYDVAIIGGGPAGMMAAGVAGALGAQVLLLEKNLSLGVKLLSTGGGRCNLTNNLDPKNFADKLGKEGKFLLPALYQFGSNEAMEFFENRGLKLVVENANRVFPASGQARDVLNVLIKYLQEAKVDIRLGSTVAKIICQDQKIKKIVLIDGTEIEADKFIISTGGKSYPATGSTGAGYDWVRELGHTVVSPTPALVPILVREKITQELEGLSLKNARFSLYQGELQLDSRIGDAMFMAQGLSGPAILDLSRNIKAAVGEMKLVIDFMPELNAPALDQQLQAEFKKTNNKQFKNSLVEMLPPKLIPVLIKLSGIDPEKKVNLVTKEERQKVVHFLKEFQLNVQGVAGYDKANVTAGGVELSEVDPRTMQSKIITNLYFAGEILDLDGPTGGYNLQICWSTGYAAGAAMRKK